MTTPTREQVIAWARAADCTHVDLEGDRAKAVERLTRFLAFAAGAQSREPQSDHSTARSGEGSTDRANVYAQAIVPCVTGCRTPRLCEAGGCIKLKRSSTGGEKP